MKKIMIMLLFTFSALFVSAQYTVLTSSSYTVTNGGTAALTATLSGGYEALGFQYVGTKVSGTVGGTAVLHASLDGTNFVPIGDTLTQADQTTNTFLWEVNNSPYKYYKVLITGTGTMVETVTGSVWRRGTINSGTSTYTMGSPNVSITNGGTSYLTYTSISQPYESLAIQANITKISGTVNGIAYLEGSNDGTNFYRAVTDSLDLTNVSSQSKIWVLTSNPYGYYRVKTVGTGTMNATQSGLFLPRNY